MDLAALLALLENIETLTDAELAELLANLRTAADERLDGEAGLTDAALEELEQIATATETVTAAQAQRAADETAREERAAALAERIREAAADEDPDPDAETGDEPDPDAETVETPAEVPATAEADAEAIAAAATARPRVSRVAARRPAVVAPRPQVPTAEQVVLTASANLPGINAGARLDTPDMVFRAFQEVIRAGAGYRGARTRVPVMRAGFEDAVDVYGPARTLTRDPRHNDELITAITSPAAIMAAGGICAPAPINYDQPIIGDTTRPVRDTMMTRFGADRGGIRLFPATSIDDMHGAVSLWTAANDVTPSSPATKPCLTMTCPDDDEFTVDAIVECLKVGNFRKRFFPEQVDAWVRQIAVWQARYAENLLLGIIGTGSTQVTAAQGLGTSVDVLTNLDRAIAGFRSRHRIDMAVRLRFGAPQWLLAQMRTDIARTAYGTADERLAVADATINTFFAARAVNVTWFLDGESGQIFPAQVDGTLLGWPSTVVTYLYPEGSWLFLDGGALDFGVVRDSVLNSTNDFTISSETFESGAFHGIESLRITMDVCPDGSVAAPVDFDPCTSGS